MICGAAQAGLSCRGGQEAAWQGGLIPHLRSRAPLPGPGDVSARPLRELGRWEHKVRGLTKLSKWKEFPGA